ncbi:MAG: hypothetical protein VKJ05_07340 [Synechococcaceae cyanobacterium]|nr:hypothetical protein [Synechococcaceae cyanobacterium]
MSAADRPDGSRAGHSADQPAEIRAPMEAHGSYRGADWSPERLVFHHNLETFADRVGLIVALQANGKLSQEQAYSRIRSLWKELKSSKDTLLHGSDPPT